MNPLRLSIAAMLLLLPRPVDAQLLAADQDARVKAIIVQLAREVERCSLAANAGDREGPAKVQLDLDERGKLRKLAVLDDLRKTDIGKCIAAFRAADPLPAAQFRGGKTIRLEFDFHPWAKRPKRVWTDVRKQLQESKAEAALIQCVRDAGADRPKKLSFAFDVSLTGQVSAVNDESPVATCFAAAVEALQFGPSENLYRVEYAWTSSSKPREARGFAVEPQECQVQDYACSWDETDPSRVNLGNAYVKQLGERIDCANPTPAVAWLEKQPHVRWVRADGCHINLLVDGARPMSFFGE